MATMRITPGSEPEVDEPDHPVEEEKRREPKRRPDPIEEPPPDPVNQPDGIGDPDEPSPGGTPDAPINDPVDRPGRDIGRIDEER